MKLLNKFFKKDDSEEEHFEIDENGNRKTVLTYEEEQEIQDKMISLENMINNLNLEEINKIQELVEKRISVLHNEYGLSDTLSKKVVDDKVASKKSDLNVDEIVIKSDKSVGTKEVNEHIDEDFLNNETIEVDGDIIIDADEEYVEFDDNSFVDEKVEKEEVKEVQIKKEEKKVENVVPKKTEETVQRKSIDDKDIFERLKGYFGEANVFFETRNDLKNEVLKGKEVYCYGIRNREAFSDEGFDVLKQNSWFIRNIKRFEELKNFKMINSSNVEKNLVWDNGDFIILICYKAINMLENMNEFNFN